MKRYIQTIHTRSDAHKKRFAFGVSSGFTILLFTFWFLARFGVPGNDIVAEQDTLPRASDRIAVTPGRAIENTATPFDTIGSGVASAYAAFKVRFGEAKKALEAVDIEAEYQEMKSGALPTDYYGNQ